MNGLQDEIRKSVLKHLPQETGVVLTKRLEQADRDADDLKIANINLSDKERVIKQQQEKIRSLEKASSDESVVEARRKSISIRENLLAIEILNIKLEESEKRADISVNFVNSLVRNTMFRKNILDTQDKGGNPIMDATGYAHYPVPSSRNFQETKSEE